MGSLQKAEVALPLAPAPPLLPTNIRDALVLAKARLEARYGARLRDVRLFGSRAWGTPRADSDVDVAIVLDDATGLDRAEATSIVAEVAVETDTDLMPMVWNAAELARQARIGVRLATDLLSQGVPV